MGLYGVIYGIDTILDANVEKSGQNAESYYITLDNYPTFVKGKSHKKKWGKEEKSWGKVGDYLSKFLYIRCSKEQHSKE